MLHLTRAVGAALILSLGLPSTTGCIYATAEIHRSPPIGARPTAPVPGAREVLVETPFADRRRTLGRCGVKKNGIYNMETADVVCTAAPGLCLARSLAEGLEAAGFRVLPQGSIAGPDTVVVRGVLSQFFIEPRPNGWDMTLEADIGLKLTVTTPSGLVAERRFYVKGEESSMNLTDADFQEASDDATDQIVRAAVLAIRSLLDRYASADASAPNVAMAAGSGR